MWFIDASGRKRVAHEGIAFPNGVRLSPDQAFLMVADTASRWVWSFRVQADGSLVDGMPFYRLETPDEVESGPPRSGADGFTVDTGGYLYIATKLGIQIADPIGRVVGILNKPRSADPSNVVFGGADMQTLYVTTRDKVYRRAVRRKGAPPRPRL